MESSQPLYLWPSFPGAISVNIRQNSGQEVSHVKGRKGQKCQGMEEIDRTVFLYVELHC